MDEIHIAISIRDRATDREFIINGSFNLLLEIMQMIFKAQSTPGHESEPEEILKRIQEKYG